MALPLNLDQDSFKRPPLPPSLRFDVMQAYTDSMMGDISTNLPEVATSVSGRRNPSTSNRRPNYLRASTGSCHDFCKFGKAYSVERKPRIPHQKTRVASKSTDDQVFTRNATTFPEVKKKRAITLRSKSFPAPQSYHIEDISNFRKDKPTLQLDRRKPFLVSAKDTSILKPSCSNLRNDGSPQTKGRRLSRTPISPMKSIYGATRRVFFNPPSLIKIKEDVKNNEHLSSSSTSSLHSRKYVEPKKPLPASLSSKPFIMGKRGTTKSVHLAVKRLIPQYETKKEKDVVVVDKSTDVENEEESKSLPTKLVVDQVQIDNEFMVEIAATTLSIPNSFSLSFQEEDQIENDTTCSQISVPTSHCSSSSFVVVSSKEEQELEREEEEQQEIMETENVWEASSSLEIQKEENETEVHCSSLSGTVVYNVLDFDENEGESPAAKGIEIGVEEVTKPVKLQSNRGKILDLKSGRNNVPTRLRFKRVRRIGEKQDVNVVALKKTMVRGGFNGCGDGSVGRSGKVVLRHSEQDAKKEGQTSLLNNVIEETASKLVETRKSKVKALVGAFETVMSLSDTKLGVNAGG